MKLDRRGGEPDNRVGGLAFDALVEQHWESVYRLVYHLCGNVHDAQDLAQETFLKAIGARSSFREGTNLRAWLARIASNTFLDLRRRKKSSKQAPLEVDVPVISPDLAEGGEILQVVAAAIAQLDDTQRAVFLLRTQEDLSFREIAESLRTTEETARWHMMQARRKLAKQLDGKV